MQPEESASHEQNTRTQILIAIIGAISTVVVATITVLPNLVKKDVTPPPPATLIAVLVTATPASSEGAAAPTSAPVIAPTAAVIPAAATVAVSRPTTAVTLAPAPTAATRTAAATAAGKPLAPQSPRIIAANAAQLAETRTGQPFGSPYGIALSPDGTTLVVATAFSGEVYDFADLEEPFYEFGSPENGPTDTLALSPDGSLVALAAGGQRPTIPLFDLDAGGIVVRTLEGHTQMMDVLAFSPDGTRLASGSRDNSVRVWDVATGDQLMRAITGDRGVTSVTFSAGGQTVLSGDSEGQIRVWSLAGEELQTIEAGELDIVDLAFSPDGTLLVSAGAYDDAVRLWDAATLAPVKALRGHERTAGYGVWCIAFSPDGALLASGGGDKTIRIWDLDSASPTYGQSLVTLTGHSDWPNRLLFTPDGSALVSSSARDGTIRVWQVR